MELHHGNDAYEPPIDAPEAIRASGPYFVRKIAEEMLGLLEDLYIRFGPYLSDEDIQDIAREAHRRVMAELPGLLVTDREHWEEDGLWWEAWEDPTAAGGVGALDE